MLSKKLKNIVFAALFIGLPTVGSAAHIDALGINISLLSSNGAGSFSLQYDEYFGSDGWMWTGSQWRYANGGYLNGGYLNGSINDNITIIGASLTNTLNNDITFQGLVDSLGSPTAGFSAGQASTQFINNTTDAALYSGIVSYRIDNFNPNISYAINVIADDCCFVNINGESSSDSITFVVGNVPEPTSLALLGLGLLGFGARARCKKLN